MLVSAAVGSNQLCIFEQWCEPGTGAPTHHHGVKEVLTVLEGQADVWLDGDTSSLGAGQSLIIPAGHPHGFRNSLSSTLHLGFVLAAPIFEGAYEDKAEMTRRWLPGSLTGELLAREPSFRDDD
jgi:quercetin dioxygenase-like cupin family protein